MHAELYDALDVIDLIGRLAKVIVKVTFICFIGINRVVSDL